MCDFHRSTRRGQAKGPSRRVFGSAGTKKGDNTKEHQDKEVCLSCTPAMSWEKSKGVFPRHRRETDNSVVIM